MGDLLFLIALFCPHFSSFFFFFLLRFLNFSTPLSFHSFLPFSFLLSWFLPLETQLHTEQKSGREREGASVVIDQLFAAPTAAPRFSSQPISFHCR